MIKKFIKIYFCVIYILLSLYCCLCIPLNEDKFQINNKSKVASNVENLRYYEIKSECDFTADYKPNQFISNEQRIKLCKTEHPTYEYDELEEEDQNELNNKDELNPCRVDCVVYDKSSKHKLIYTVYFKDGKTKCGDKKVCEARNDVGACCKY